MFPTEPYTKLDICKLTKWAAEVLNRPPPIRAEEMEIINRNKETLQKLASCADWKEKVSLVTDEISYVLTAIMDMERPTFIFLK